MYLVYFFYSEKNILQVFQIIKLMKSVFLHFISFKQYAKATQTILFKKNAFDKRKKKIICNMSLSKKYWDDSLSIETKYLGLFYYCVINSYGCRL